MTQVWPRFHLCDFYQSYALEEARERQTAAGHVLSAHVKNVVRAIVRLMMNPNVSPRVQLRAAIYIIDRELGPALKAPIDPDRPDPVTALLKAYGIIDDQTNEK